MMQRVAYSALALAIMFAIVLLDVDIAQWSGKLEGPVGDLLRRGSLLPVAIAVTLMIGAFELTRCFATKSTRPHRWFACLMTMTLVLTPWLSAAGWLGHGAAQVEGLYWPIVLLCASVIGAGALTVFRGRPENALHDVSATLTIIFYLGFMGSFAIQIRSGRDVPEADGAWLLLISLLVIRASDIGAFFVGSAFGRHKLAPGISPGKTVEGMLGGFLASSGLAVLLVLAHSWMGGLVAEAGGFNPDESVKGIPALIADMTRAFATQQNPNAISPLLRAMIFGLILSAVGQTGDLVESCFKRDAHIKDSGGIIPQVGGILDLADSPLAALPVAWFLLTGVWSIA